MRARQLSLLPKPRTRHGGDLALGRRKLARPLDPKRSLQVVLKSSRARGAWSLLHPRHAGQVEHLVRRCARKREVRLERFANVGNHLHLLVQGRTRRGLQAFFREAAGVVAMLVTGARKGRPRGRFWDAVLFTRVVEWGRDFAGARLYLVKNVFEAAGLWRPGTRVVRCVPRPRRASIRARTSAACADPG